MFDPELRPVWDSSVWDLSIIVDYAAELAVAVFDGEGGDEGEADVSLACSLECCCVDLRFGVSVDELSWCLGPIKVGLQLAYAISFRRQWDGLAVEIHPLTVLVSFAVVWTISRPYTSAHPFSH